MGDRLQIWVILTYSGVDSIRLSGRPCVGMGRCAFAGRANEIIARTSERIQSIISKGQRPLSIAGNQRIRLVREIQFPPRWSSALKIVIARFVSVFFFALCCTTAWLPASACSKVPPAPAAPPPLPAVSGAVTDDSG